MTTALVKALHRLRDFLQDVFSALETIILIPSLFGDVPPHRRRRAFLGAHWRRRSLAAFADEVERLFTGALVTEETMLDMSEQIRQQFRTCLQSSSVCMLPSYNYALPSGREKGTYLALDVGGSTLRVALVELKGREEGVSIVRVSSSPIDNAVKLLEGAQFFGWMATQIESMLADVGAEYGRSAAAPLSVGLSWSFPVDQTSIRSGLVLHMGKGFLCSNGTVGQELGQLIVEACAARGLSVRVDAILNDSSAALLSRAYADPQTRMSLILGTGTNAAIHFPLREIGLAKFGARPPGWFARATHVIVNTEMSMFGGAGVLPRSRWDDALNRAHLRPDYQPLEYMTTGRYLGEIVRLIIVDAVDSARLFAGDLPHSLREPYSLDTSILAFVEADSSPGLASSAALLQKEHTFVRSPSAADLLFLKRVCHSVSTRAAAYLATAVHSMWCLHNEAEAEAAAAAEEEEDNDRKSPDVRVDSDVQHVQHVQHAQHAQHVQRSLSIACDGSVINKYPGFKDRCQTYLTRLVRRTAAAAADGQAPPSVCLEAAPESAILGAAVAVAVAVAEKTA